ncbi:MAG: aldose 1-epimerase family protein [Deltaproteobacteria bacterium]|nr:MAG: aldose 1-epimerase family protein [Deltaproteobacteria bacterium]
MSKEVQIQSEFIEAKISTMGAELRALRDKEFNINYLWTGDPKHWPRTSPLLFPVVGELRDEKYSLGRKFYQMGRHGFARDHDFELVSSHKDRATFRFGYNDETYRIYPFKFILEVEYIAYGPKLSMEATVFNVDNKEILFSIGFHPAFSIPLREGKLEDYYIEFDERESRGAYFLDNGLINFEHQDDRRMFDGRRIPLSEEIFKFDALVFKDLISKRVTLKNKIDAREVIIDTHGAPYLGIWKKPDAPFICIEPWHGVADSVRSDGDFFKKEGIIVLDKGENYKAQITIQVN